VDIQGVEECELLAPLLEAARFRAIGTRTLVEGHGVALGGRSREHSVSHALVLGAELDAHARASHDLLDAPAQEVVVFEEQPP